MMIQVSNGEYTNITAMKTPVKNRSIASVNAEPVRKLRMFEQKLVLGYEAYIKSLATLAKSTGSDKEVGV